MPRKRSPATKPSKAAIKAAAERAERRARGEDVDADRKAPIHPPVKTAAELKAEKKKPKRGRGRPSRYTPAVGRAICKMLRAGMSVKAIGARPRMPGASTILDWAHNPEHPFSAPYARAREVGFLKLADELIEISDDGSNDFMERRSADGEVVGYSVNGEAVARSRLRVDTRKWVLAKMLPKVYGEKAAVEMSGPGGAPLQVEDVSKLDLARWIAHQLAAATAKPIPLTAAE